MLLGEVAGAGVLGLADRLARAYGLHRHRHGPGGGGEQQQRGEEVRTDGAARPLGHPDGRVDRGVGAVGAPRRLGRERPGVGRVGARQLGVVQRPAGHAVAGLGVNRQAQRTGHHPRCEPTGEHAQVRAQQPLTEQAKLADQHRARAGVLVLAVLAHEPGRPPRGHRHGEEHLVVGGHRPGVVEQLQVGAHRGVRQRHRDAVAQVTAGARRRRRVRSARSTAAGGPVRPHRPDRAERRPSRRGAAASRRTRAARTPCPCTASSPV